MSDQIGLRRRIARLEGQQRRRIALADERRRLNDKLIEKKDREIANLKARLTIGAVS